MNYFISRGGQQYGPYALPDLQNYLAQGSIQYSDLARTDSMSEWLPLSQLLQQPLQATPVAQIPQVAPRGTGPIPPSLHWALVLLLGMFTGLFTTVWMFIQASFIKKIDPQNKATMLYALGLVAVLAGSAIAVIFAILAAPRLQNQDASGPVLGIGLGLLMVVVIFAGTVLFIVGAFSIRSSMLRYYNTVEPINLRLSGVMTFFFNTLYFQYHFSRIAKWKETGIIYPQ
jgi:GYF domain 2